MSSDTKTKAPVVTTNFLYAIAKAQSETFQSMANQQATDTETVLMTVKMLQKLMDSEKSELAWILQQMEQNKNEDNNEFAYWQEQYNAAQSRWGNVISQQQTAVSQNQGIVSTDGTNLQQQLQIMNAVNGMMQLLGSLLSANY